jgi:hypothetical protein
MCKNCLLLKPIILLKHYENYKSDTESCTMQSHSSYVRPFVRFGFCAFWLRPFRLSVLVGVGVCARANNFNNTVACTDPLLGSDRETDNETTSVARQHIF